MILNQNHSKFRCSLHLNRCLLFQDNHWQLNKHDNNLVISIKTNYDIGYLILNGHRFKSQSTKIILLRDNETQELGIEMENRLIHDIVPFSLINNNKVDRDFFFAIVLDSQPLFFTLDISVQKIRDFNYRIGSYCKFM